MQSSSLKNFIDTFSLVLYQANDTPSSRRYFFFSVDPSNRTTYYIQWFSFLIVRTSALCQGNRIMLVGSHVVQYTVPNSHYKDCSDIHLLELYVLLSKWWEETKYFNMYLWKLSYETVPDLMTTYFSQVQIYITWFTANFFKVNTNRTNQHN